LNPIYTQVLEQATLWARPLIENTAFATYLFLSAYQESAKGALAFSFQGVDKSERFESECNYQLFACPYQQIIIHQNRTTEALLNTRWQESPEG